jgi:uncharacterized protein
VPWDDAEAEKWLRKAADQGYADARYLLGVMYARGQYVPQNYVLAYMWFDLAAAKSFQDAPKSRDIVAAEMTPAQIVEAQRLAREWKPSSK